MHDRKRVVWAGLRRRNLHRKSPTQEDLSQGSKSFEQKEDPAGAVTKIIGGGAFHANDKIIQHNGCGKVEVSRLKREEEQDANEIRSTTFTPRTTVKSTEHAGL